MPYYEVVYETGRMSVMGAEDDAAAQEALKNHNDRAASGQPGGPLGQPAERIAAVYAYDRHPMDLNPEQTMSADVLKTEVDGLIDSLADENGVVNIDTLTTAVRGLSHPMSDKVDLDGFGSRFKMKETKKFDMAFLEGKGSK